MSADTKECPFCAETIMAKAKYCRFCGHYLEGHTQESILRDYIGSDHVGEDKISAGGFNDVKGAAVGREAQAASTGNVEGSFIQAHGDVTLGKEHRDAQYEVALNWRVKGKPRMQGFDLENRNLKKVSLAGAEFRNASFRGANLSGADLQGTNLRGANLIRTNLSGANLFKANLSDADMRYANLRSTDLREANLSKTDLRGTKLINTDLSRANLRGANLKRGRIFLRTDLSGTKLNGAEYSKKTIWPGGFKPEAVGAILVDNEGDPVEEPE